MNRLRDEILMQPLDPARGDLWKIHRTALPNGAEWWLVPIHHLAADARGWLQAFDTLFDYMQAPPRDPRPDLSPRDWNALWRLRPPADAQNTVRVGPPRRLRSPWRPVSFRQPRRYRMMRLPPEESAALRRRAKEVGGTLTDAIHAAVCRCLQASGGFACRDRDAEWITLAMLVDLRRLIETPLGFGNFSGAGRIALRCPLPDRLPDLVAELVAQRTRSLHPRRLLREVQGLRRMRLIPPPLLALLSHRVWRRPEATSAAVTNVGDLDRQLPHARGLPISHAGIVGFAHPKVQFVVGASSFRGTLSLGTGFVEGPFRGERMDQVSRRLRQEVERLIS
jgi:NRPS condensation-like uncharacterized protein